MTINTAKYNGEYWIAAGDNAKLNVYGLAYTTPGNIQSIAVASFFGKYSSITLSANYTLNNEEIDFYLSSNNGGTWIQVTPGTGV
ncbi:MAG TPA: hypothetical protein PKZ78_11500, partial [Candidatus Goldiibacteriota bacterium]|nr:hypothetical protein [Candidatus Goldiibacteriota bacterium]